NGSLLAFLRAPQHPELFEDIFLVTEGFRVAVGLWRAYPGLRGEQRQLAGQFLSRQAAGQPPSQPLLFDALLAALLAGSDAVLPGCLRSVVLLAAPCVAPLVSPTASVNDALAVAQILAMQLSEGRQRGSQAAAADSFFDTVAGEVLMDSYLSDET